MLSNEIGAYVSFKIIEISTVRISTNNVNESRNFYSALLNILPFEDLDNFVSFKVANVNLDITLSDEKSPSSTGGSVSYFLVDNLDEVIRKSISLGAKVYRGPLKVNEIKRTIVQIIDPVGNVVGFEEVFKNS